VRSLITNLPAEGFGLEPRRRKLPDRRAGPGVECPQRPPTSRLDASGSGRILLRACADACSIKQPPTSIRLGERLRGRMRLSKSLPRGGRKPIRHSTGSPRACRAATARRTLVSRSVASGRSQRTATRSVAAWSDIEVRAPVPGEWFKINSGARPRARLPTRRSNRTCRARIVQRPAHPFRA
jgi:hypothetical protein